MTFHRIPPRPETWLSCACGETWEPAMYYAPEHGWCVDDDATVCPVCGKLAVTDA